MVALFVALAMARHGTGRFISRVVQPRLAAGGQPAGLASHISPLSAGTYLDEGNRIIFAGMASGAPRLRGILLQRGREKQGIGMALSGFDCDSVLYSMLCDPLRPGVPGEGTPQTGFARAVRESDIVSYPRNLMLDRYIASRLRGGVDLRGLAADLAQVSSLEPFYLSIYVYRGNIARMAGNREEARRLFRRAALLSREAGKRHGLNDYEKTMVETGRAW
jgi:hypothetical protein